MFEKKKKKDVSTSNSDVFKIILCIVKEKKSNIIIFNALNLEKIYLETT